MKNLANANESLVGQLEQMQLKNYQDRKVFEEAKAKLNVIPEDQDVRGLETRLEALKKDNKRLKDILRCADKINNDMKKKAQDDKPDHGTKRKFEATAEAAAEAAPSEYFSCSETSPADNPWSLKKEKVTIELSDDEPVLERVTEHSGNCSKMIDLNEEKPVVTATEHDGTDSPECDTQAFGVALNIKAPPRADTSQVVYRRPVYTTPELTRLCELEKKNYPVEG